ncbi:glycosyltransferase [Bacteroidota bacterium]
MAATSGQAIKPKTGLATKRISKRNIASSLLVEVAWEVCNQVGGIYTVIRSKAPSAINRWGNNYCVIGPYIHQSVETEFEEIMDAKDPFARVVNTMREQGFDAHYGKWLITGRPTAVLLNPLSVYDRLGSIKYEIWNHHDISCPDDDDLLNQVIMFGYLVKVFFSHLALDGITKKRIVGHFHEWMAGIPIPELRFEKIPVSTIFTTHATMLGRYLAMNDPEFYDHLAFFNWLEEAKNFNIETQVRIERAAAHGAHIFSTVSDVTANECKHLIGRKPDQILPNGLNIKRFVALHEFQNLHKENKDRINQFIMSHFFPSYSFDLDKTLYFFTSGRFEYKNKGFDLSIEALARLNHRLKEEGVDITIVMFFVTRQPFHSINPKVLHSRAVLEELRVTISTINEQVGQRLFYHAPQSEDHRLPNLNDFVDDYWRLRYRRTLQSFKSNELPPIVTHNLVNDGQDQVLSFLRSANLLNHKDDKVKIVYHPDFISPTNPLFGMEYNQFVRGCHLGVFPSLYEPWGYTPLECLASAVPAVTSNLSGFGDYVLRNVSNLDKKAIFVVNNKNKDFYGAAQQLADQLYSFARLSRRQRIEWRNKAESSSVHFDWNNLISYYDRAHQKAYEVKY